MVKVTIQNGLSSIVLADTLKCIPIFVKPYQPLTCANPDCIIPVLRNKINVIIGQTAGLVRIMKVIFHVNAIVAV